MVSAGRVAGCRPRLNGRDRSSAATGRARPLESAAHGARVFCKLQRCGYGNLDLDGLGASSAGPPPTNEARRRGNGAGDDLLGSAVMQMVERPWGITAFGAASVKAVPDLVRIRFKVVRVEQSPTAAFEACAARCGSTGSATRRSRVRGWTSRTPPSTWTGTRKFVGYQCQAAFAVESGALDDVEPLLVDVVAAGANEIEGVDFDVIAKRELRAEARRKAVAAARAKADLYAEATGVRIGAVLHVEDADPEQHGASRYRSHAEAAATTAQDLAPGHIVVSAAVILGYAVARD